MFATFTCCRGKQRHECMKGKGIWKERLVAAMKVAARNSRSIKRKAHVRETRPNELCVDGRVMRERRAKESIIVIKLVGEDMLEFETLDCCTKCPKGRGIL